MNPRFKPWIKWGVALLLLALIGAGVLRALSARKLQSQQLAAATAAKDLGLAELAATDVFKAQVLEIAQGLQISGSLKAVNSALVKARVAGELQGLTVREGDFVKAGQLLARIDASEYQLRVRQSQSQAESAKAQVDAVQRQYDNNKALVAQGFISKTSLDTSLANLNAAQATYRAALAATDISSKLVADTAVRAPISGQVSQRLAQTGERVGVDTRIVEIIDISQLELEATLSATDSVNVRVGQTAELQIEGSSRRIAAKVARINPSALAGSRNVLAYLSLDNNADSSAGGGLPLRQGLFASGTLGTERIALMAVPVSSLRTDKPAPYVQIIESNAVVHQTVAPGVRGKADGQNVVAVQGLAAGAVVIRGNIGALREGTQVLFTTPVVAVSPALAARAAASRPAP